MTSQESKVKSFVMLGNIPFTESASLVNANPQQGNTTKFIMNTRIKYEISRVELSFNNQAQAFQYIQGSTPGIIELDIGSLNLLIHLLKFGAGNNVNTETNLTFTCGPNGLASQIWGSLARNGHISIFKINGINYSIDGSAQHSLLLTQLEIALDMLSKGSIDYSVKREHIAGRMQGGSTPPAGISEVVGNGSPGSTPPAMPIMEQPVNDMNTAPEVPSLQRPNFGPDLNKAPASPAEIVPTIPNKG